ncbi:MAG: DUF4422 domain-containing protein [Chitinispirillales bacterium]|jgi:hypothetical protein|nr:DUF4422 domain-containing protein [Chitinispirillales bacterium]
MRQPATKKQTAFDGDSQDCRIKIPVCYYQSWELPKNALFLPVQAGKAVSKFNLKIQGDDTGDNISAKNATFSEFTVWYWVWKNIKKLYPNLEYTGMQHYRRYFDLERPFDMTSINYRSNIPNMKNYDRLYIERLSVADIIMTKPTHLGLDLKTHYASQHYESDYLCVRDVIHDICPEYGDSFKSVFESNSLSLCCIFVSKYGLFDDYLSWLFPILFETEKRIDVTGYGGYQKRSLAFLAERLLNVYVRHHKLNVSYEPVYFIQPAIDYRNGIGRLCKDVVKYCLPHGLVKLVENRYEGREIGRRR